MDPKFREHYGLPEKATDRQFPVGLFSQARPSNESRVFPSGKSAIDLVALYEDHLWIFE